MKRTITLLVTALLLMAGVQTAGAQGFRVYQSDGTELQFSMKTDSIVFDNGLSGDEVFGPFTPVNLCIVGTWYKSKTETVTFNADGTTDYVSGATYKFFPYQGNLVIYNAGGAPLTFFRVLDVTAEKMLVMQLGSNSLSQWSTTPMPTLVQEIQLSSTTLSMKPDETKTLTATVLPDDADNPNVTWSSSDENVAEVSKKGLVIAYDEGTCTITCSATDGSGVYAECQVTVSFSDTNGHEFVEIGGLKWATMNVGATTEAGSYETCYGDYFAWGETEPRYTTITRKTAKEADFIWKSGYTTGYSSSNYPTYTGTTLDASHDAATANWGGSWRTPTNEEYEALAKACSGSSENGQTPVELSNTITEGGIYWLSSTQTIEPSYTGVAGLLFVSKTDISKRVFFPACGRGFDTKLNRGGENGYYWSSTLNTSFTDKAYQLYFHDNLVSPSNTYERYYGLSVRPVSY